MVELDEMKSYLRVDYDDDDDLIESLISASEKMCADVAREDDISAIEDMENAKVAVLYSTAYLYEHREEADHNQLMLTLRALLFSKHEGGF